MEILGQGEDGTMLCAMNPEEVHFVIKAVLFYIAEKGTAAEMETAMSVLDDYRREGGDMNGIA